MNKNENGFSLVVVVIFMSIAALFVGYIMGSWLISFLIEDSSTKIAEQEKNSAVVKQQKTKKINNTENNLTTPTEEELKIAPDQNNKSGAAPAANTVHNAEKEGGYGVQIGAFSNYNNALSVKDKVIELGFEVVVTDSSPHQVQVVGYQNREQAESAAAELEGEGYPGFIVIRE